MIAQDPTASPSPWYALVEVNRMKGGVPGALQAGLEEALERGHHHRRGAGGVRGAADGDVGWRASNMNDVQIERRRLDQARRVGADRQRAAAARRGHRGGGAAGAGHPAAGRSGTWATAISTSTSASRWAPTARRSWRRRAGARGDLRGRAAARRLGVGGARHRAAEDRAAEAGEGPGGARDDAGDQDRRSIPTGSSTRARCSADP